MLTFTADNPPNITNQSPTPFFFDATVNIIITEGEVKVKFQKRAHNPLLIAACFDKIDQIYIVFGH